MSRSSTAKVILAIVVIVVVIGGYIAWRNSQSNSKLPIPIPVSADPTVDAAPVVPSASSSEPPTSGDPDGYLQDVGDAAYHNNSQCLSLTSKSMADGGWSVPYPHRLIIQREEDRDKVDLDCGFFPTLQGGKWRLAYCLEDDKRVPRKLYLLTQKKNIVVQVDSHATGRTQAIHANFQPGACK